MASQKPARILRSKTDLSTDEIASMPDDQAWNVIYSLKGEPKKKPITICFTGFSASESDLLQVRARESGLEVRTGVNRSLDYLCAGPTPGPSKMSKAQEFDVRVLTVDDFEKIAEAGELPE